MTIHPIYRARHGLTPAAREVLDAGQYAILGTVNEDHSAHLAPLMYTFVDDVFLFETSASTRKARNVDVRGHATVLVLDPRAENAAWVAGSGPAEVLRDAEAEQAGRSVRERNLTAVGREEIGDVLARYDDAAIRVRPNAWLAWDMTELTNTFAEHGVSFDHADDWFASGPV